MIQDDDGLDRLLREDARAALPDDGFTARVMSALPPRAPAFAARAWLKPALVLGSTVLGSILAVAFTPADANVVQGFIDLARLRILTPAALTGLALAAALLLSAIILATDTD